MKTVTVVTLGLVSLILFLATSRLAGAAYPSTFGIQLPLTAPKLVSLVSDLKTTGGTSNVILQLAYVGKAGFGCAAGSTIDGQPADCTAKQANTRYGVTVKGGSTRITLTGMTTQGAARATYKGPKGRLPGQSAAVRITAESPVVSTLLLSPVVSGGRLVGTGRIVSGYGGTDADSPLKGAIKRGKVTWSLRSGSGTLSFAGREADGTWTGRLTGNLGPAKVATVVAIPLQLYVLPQITAPVPTAPITPPVTPPAKTGNAHIHGTVLKRDQGGIPTPFGNVTITVRSDLNGNTVLDSAEIATVQSDGKGQYSLDYPSLEGRTVMIDFAREGYSKTPKIYSSIAPGADIVVSTTLKPLETLAVGGGSAQSSDGTLTLDNLPGAIASVGGLVLNPRTDSSQFPGQFSDSTGNLLVSSVFVAIEARDAVGQPVHALASPATLRMQVPDDGDTRKTLQDAIPGNGQIDVPLYYYDEADGQWKREGTGWLEDDSKTKLLESDLVAVRDGNKIGPFYAVGSVRHFSYWNVDWPITTHACVSGRVVDSSGNPVAGVTVSAKGKTYTGTSSPQTTDNQGRFCVDGMRSEGPGDDFDGDGTQGTQHQITLTVYANGKYYEFGPYTMPQNQGSCPNGCLGIADLILDVNKELQSGLCTITGKTVFSGTWNGTAPGLNAGDSVGGTTVFGFDPDAQDALVDCVLNNQGCSLSATSGADGMFSLKVPVLYGIELVGYQFTASSLSETALTDGASAGLAASMFSGDTSTTGCPGGIVTLPLDFAGGSIQATGVSAK